MKERPSLDEIFTSAPQAASRPSLDDIFMQPAQEPNIPVQAEQQPETQPQTGFQADMMQRGAKLANIINATSQGQQTIPEGVIQGVMNQVGAAGDMVGAGLGVLAKGAYNIMPEAGQQRIDSDMARFSEVASPYMQQYKQNEDAFNAANPRAGRNFEAVRELGNILPLGIKPVRSITGAGVEKGADAFKSALTKELAPLASKERKLYSSALYDEADALGGVLKPEARERFRSEIAKHADVGGERLTSEKSVFEDMLETTELNKDKPLTLKGFETIDKKLTGLIHKERGIAGLSDEGRRMMELQDNLRELVDNPDPNMVMGGTEGFNALRNATKEYKIAKQQEELESIIEYANKTDNPATSLKAQMRVLAKNKKRMAGYDTEARKLINKAAEDGKFADFLRTTGGSRLIGGMIGGMVGAGSGAAVGGGLGAIPGAIGGAVTGMASRAGAKAIKTGQIRKIEKSITSRSGAENIPREIYDLPPAEAKEAIRKLREAK